MIWIPKKHKTDYPMKHVYITYVCSNCGCEQETATKRCRRCKDTEIKKV